MGEIEYVQRRIDFLSNDIKGQAFWSVFCGIVSVVGLSFVMFYDRSNVGVWIGTVVIGLMAGFNFASGMKSEKLLEQYVLKLREAK